MSHDPANPVTLADLIAALQALPNVAPVERAKLARKLAHPARRILGEVGDAAVYEATDTMTYAEVAVALDVSKSRINNAVTDHLSRLP